MDLREDDAVPEWARPAAVFFTRFLVFAAPFYLVLWLQPDLTVVQEWYAAATHTLLSMTGVAAEVSGPYVDTESLLLYVSRDSTAWKSMMVYTALVLAVPAVVWKRRVIGVAAGVAVLAAVNIIRITSTIYGVEVWAWPYDRLHTVLWRWLLTAAVLLVWGVWLYAVKKPVRSGK